jgi:2-deoxy-D-gluconate 3-dehydrogenase
VILDSFRLDGKVAVVTGSTRGLGQSAAVALAEAGADLALIDRSVATETAQRVTDIGLRLVIGWGVAALWLAYFLLAGRDTGRR